MKPPTVGTAWVYLKSKTPDRLWTVGFYTPEGRWEAESDHDSPEEAAQRVRWLSGGGVAEGLPELVNAIRAIANEHGKPDYALIEERRAQWDRLYAALAMMES